MAQSVPWKEIPTQLTIEQFEEFVLPHLHIGSREPQPKLSLYVIFNYILKRHFETSAQGLPVGGASHQKGQRRQT